MQCQNLLNQTELEKSITNQREILTSSKKREYPSAAFHANKSFERPMDSLRSRITSNRISPESTLLRSGPKARALRDSRAFGGQNRDEERRIRERKGRIDFKSSLSSI